MKAANEKEITMHTENLNELHITITKDDFTRRFQEVINALKRDKQLVWLDEYKQLLEWLRDNKRMGLLIEGPCGVGKTLIARYLIPQLIQENYGLLSKFFTSVEMVNNLKDACEYAPLIIDDIGVEPRYKFNFGEKIEALGTVMDAVEQDSKLVIMTTNLSAEDLLNYYGSRTYDRIRGYCHLVKIAGLGYSLR